MAFHRWWTLVLIALVGALAAGCGSAASDAPASTAGDPAAQGSASEGLAARVNGVSIPLEAFQRALERERSSRQALGQPIPADGALFEREVLDQMIEAVLIEQAAQAEGITLGESDLDAQIAQSIEEAGGEESWNAWLKMNNLTPEEHRAQLRTAVLGSGIAARIAAETPTTAEQVHARHILVDTQSAAQNVINELQAGADFAELAGRYSIDASTRETGGDLSWFARGQLLEREVEEAAFALKPGETSGVVVSRLGYHIIQTLEVDPDRPVDEPTRQNMIQLAIERWRQALWDNAVIERFVGADG